MSNAHENGAGKLLDESRLKDSTEKKEYKEKQRQEQKGLAKEEKPMEELKAAVKKDAKEKDGE